MYYQWIKEELILDCRIQPNANADYFAEIVGNRLKIRITAARRLPPELKLTNR